MSWLDDLVRELRARGVPEHERRRIVYELGDHIACEPGCEDRLRDPRALATTFADELSAAEARSSAFATFVALAAAAVVLLVSLVTLARHVRGLRRRRRVRAARSRHRSPPGAPARGPALRTLNER